ncbi:MAG: ABC transporter substrate-binding protein [Sulfurimonas sp.]|nr:ABC transporter substrate-binding protein [Sulfurimonas sp.]
MLKSIMTLFVVLFLSQELTAQINKQKVEALYIPLADHYAALVAYERYSKDMKYADYKIIQMKNWDLLRAYFLSGEVDMAYVMSPLAMDMYRVKPNFKWVGLMHRDGNALAINDLMNNRVKLPKFRRDRKPDEKVAKTLKELYKESKVPTQIGIPHILSTHSVVLYKYLKEYGVNIHFKLNKNVEVQGITIAPPKSPAFIKSKSSRAIPAAFEQSLPWADVVETQGYGYVAWYSKDVMEHKDGHVECIALATDKAIKTKFDAIKEVMYYIKKAGADIEKARKVGGEELDEIVKIIRKHIKAHTKNAIIASLDYDLYVINYKNLNIDKDGLKQIMDYAYEGNIIKEKIDISTFADERFDEK